VLVTRAELLEKIEDRLANEDLSPAQRKAWVRLRNRTEKMSDEDFAMTQLGNI
jgi:hypothetical protein